MSNKLLMAEEKNQAWWHVIEKREVILGLSGVILGQAILFAVLRPFALAWLAVTLAKDHRQGMVVFCGVAVGLLSHGFNGEYFSNLLVAVFLALIFWPQDFWTGRHWLMAPLAAVTCNMFLKTVFYFLPMVYNYSQWGIMVESMLIGAFFWVGGVCLDSVDKLRRQETLVLEAQLAWLLLTLAFLLGLDSWHLAGLDLQSVCSRVLILAAAYLSGSGGGAVLGVLVGVIPSLMGGVTAAAMGFYGLAGLLGGLLKPLGKVGIWVGFLTGNLLLMIYFGQGGQVWLTILETALAGVFFAALPLEQRALMPEPDSGYQEVEVADSEQDKIEKIGRIFLELSEELTAVEPNEAEQVLESLDGMYKRVYIQVCNNCNKGQQCWERECVETYQEFSAACDCLERQRIGQGACFSHQFLGKCQRTAELEVALLNQIDLIKQQKYYQEQVAMAKETVARQLAGIGQVVKGLSHATDYARAAEKRLWQNCNREHLPLEKIRVYENAQHDWEIALQLKCCQGEKYCQQTLPGKISKWLRRGYQLADTVCPHHEGMSCQMKLIPLQSCQVVVGMAGTTKSGNTVSGDSWATLELAPGKQVVLLSDGMGAGLEAHRQSATTVRLLQRLLAGGITDQLALEIVNAVLLLRSDQESFATVDLALLDTINKTAELVKISAAPSFIRHHGQVRAFESCSLPVGILNEVDIARQTHPLAAGDLLIMMSDGVYEAYGQDGDKWRTIITELPSDNPQLAAEYLLAVAVSRYDQAATDDMTVLVAKVETLP